jgi:lipid-binding SYLF domain-containing protein
MDRRQNYPSLPNRRALLVSGSAGLAATLVAPAAWADDDAAKLARDSRQALDKLLGKDDDARRLNARALAVMVFPEITKAGFIVGAQNGQGALFMGPQVVGFYQITAGSFGLQAGAQKSGLALFFMNRQALDYVRNNHGFSIGAGPSVTAINKGASKHLGTATGLQDIYAVPFNQRGLMAGVTITGSKISEIHPGR